MTASMSLYAAGISSIRSAALSRCHAPVSVLQAQLQLRGQRAGALDVLGRQLVADAAAARVQDDPRHVALVQAHLEEVVARAERAELVEGALAQLAQVARRWVGREPVLGGARRLRVPLAQPGWKCPGHHRLETAHGVA